MVGTKLVFVPLNGVGFGYLAPGVATFAALRFGRYMALSTLPETFKRPFEPGGRLDVLIISSLPNTSSNLNGPSVPVGLSHRIESQVEGLVRHWELRPTLCYPERPAAHPPASALTLDSPQPSEVGHTM